MRSWPFQIAAEALSLPYEQVTQDWSSRQRRQEDDHGRGNDGEHCDSLGLILDCRV